MGTKELEMAASIAGLAITKSMRIKELLTNGRIKGPALKVTVANDIDELKKDLDSILSYL